MPRPSAPHCERGATLRRTGCEGKGRHYCVLDQHPAVELQPHRALLAAARLVARLAGVADLRGGQRGGGAERAVAAHARAGDRLARGHQADADALADVLAISGAEEPDPVALLEDVD